MTDDELNRLLRVAKIPARENSFWENFSDRVTRKAIRASKANVAEHRSNLTFTLWALGLATACLVVGFWFGFRDGHSGGAEKQIAVAKKYFREVELLFPNQVRAIVFENGEAHLVLSDKPDVPDSSPLFVKICSGKNCRSLVTFSGQRIQINGEAFDVLSNRKGQILLVGNDSVWSSAEPTRMKNRSIQAQPLSL